MRRPLTSLFAVLAALTMLATACSDDAADEANDESTTTVAPTTEAPTTTIDTTIGDPVPTPNPEVSLPPDAGSTFYQGVGFDLSLVGYEQSEYFLSGTARSFASVGELTSDGHWVVEPADEADYTTRIVVVRPSEPADFNGTVMMEWFNVSGGLDAAPNFTMSHVEQMREGYAYVGVSAQRRGIEGGERTVDVGFPIHLKGVEAERYASLQHPGDSFSYDMFNQAAQAIRNPDGIDPLNGLEIDQVIAVGESQSAFRLVTYANAIDPVAQLFDAFLIHSRSGGASALSEEPQADIPTPEQVLIRDDVRVPVMTFQTDTDVLLLGSVPARRPDRDNFVLWEVAGTAHGDVYSISLDVGPQDLGDNPDIAAVVEVASPIPGIIDCGAPINSGPQHYVMNAAVHALASWAAGGDPPTSAPRVEVVEVDVEPDAEGRQATHAAVTDDYGNILGGVRTAWVDVPVARLTGDPVEGGNYCGLFGTTTLFDDETLAELYPTKAAYLDAMTASIEQSVTDGFLRPLDAELILQHAAGNDIGG